MTKKEEKDLLTMLIELNSNYSLTLGKNHCLTKGHKLPNGYEIKTVLWDVLGYGEENQTMEELNDFIKRYFEEEKEMMNPESLAEMVLIINHKSWYWANKSNDKMVKFYADWYYELHDWCLDNLKGDDFSTYYHIVD